MVKRREDEVEADRERELQPVQKECAHEGSVTSR